MQWQQRQYKHQGEGDGDQRRPHLRHFTGAKFIGQSAGQRRSQRPGGPGDTKAARYRAAHVIMFGEHHRQRRPEGAEGDRERPLSQRSAA